jgi:AcrR family transcriptional regulator
MLDPRATNEDLTAKARIRNAALDLYAQYGADRISLRDIASAADVTVGLVQHHFKTKAGLRDAVDQLVVDYFAHAIAEVPAKGSARHVAAARDRAVAQMLRDNPPVVDYVRRTFLEPADNHLLDVLVDLTRREVAALRGSGLASTERSESAQVLGVMVRQMGELLLQPMVDAVWDRIAVPRGGSKPRLRITVAN